LSIERDVQFQYVDARLAKKPEVAAFNAREYKLTDGGIRGSTSFRHA
jgi:hypothetical protein